ncbi:Na+/H+ antiporter NhaC [Priestia koreensis]|uniref:Sodium:proton antiporter n=1 Tax=Priestia koreensis TaxID=284581 RepID=A0A0M0LIJ1_9BACI|nr:Na+/H+ antiporter NhaC [Priestia koreensis]KOO50503.1 sodium:proton antiporter [Priestia koreensis]
MKKQPSFIQALTVIILILALIFIGLFEFKVEPHIPLIISLVFLGCLGKLWKYKWKDIEEGIVKGITLGIKPILILALVGLLISAWMSSGTIPMILSLGLDWISPKYFLISALVITVLVSTFTGSTFTTVSTVGVALMGIATAVGISPALTAGAVVSGAAFGDKMSPLSDTTNFSSGILDVKLFDHVRHMMWTTVPSLLLTAIIFIVVGFQSDYSHINLNELKHLKDVLGDQFTLSWITLISPLIVIVLSARRAEVVPTLIAGIASAFITALLIQHQFSVSDLLTFLQSGVKIDSGNSIVDGIVNKGGLQSMMWTISLVLTALSLGGVMKELGIVQALLNGLTKMIRRTGDVTLTTVLACIGVNVITGEQYLSILLPGQTFRPLYDKWGLDRKNLSRTLEDAGTLVNPLIPWGVSGAFISQALNVDVVSYLPFAFFLIFCPVFAVIWGYTGIGIAKVAPKKDVAA